MSGGVGIRAGTVPSMVKHSRSGQAARWCAAAMGNTAMEKYRSIFFLTKRMEVDDRMSVRPIRRTRKKRSDRRRPHGRPPESISIDASVKR
jgi:hypothetical protein